MSIQHSSQHRRASQILLRFIMQAWLQALLRIIERSYHEALATAESKLSGWADSAQVPEAMPHPLEAAPQVSTILDPPPSGFRVLLSSLKAVHLRGCGRTATLAKR